MMLRTILATSLLFGFAIGCDDDVDPVVDAAVPDAGMPAAPMCFEDPTTHLEIINACTTATSVTKVPVTPLLNADGTLPPLP